MPRERPLIFDMARCQFIVWGSEKKKIDRNWTPIDGQNYVSPDRSSPLFAVAGWREKEREIWTGGRKRSSEKKETATVNFWHLDVVYTTTTTITTTTTTTTTPPHSTSYSYLIAAILLLFIFFFFFFSYLHINLAPRIWSTISLVSFNNHRLPSLSNGRDPARNPSSVHASEGRKANRDGSI